jgi:presenilin-like A22 family membrane protease
MINWINLAANSLWILACALGLAGISQAAWRARLRGVRLRQLITDRPYQCVINMAGVLFCLGLAATAGTTWEMLVWALLALAFFVQLIILRPDRAG